MRRLIYILTGIAVGIIIYITLSVSTPTAQQVNTDLADSHVRNDNRGNPEKNQELNDINGGITTFLDNGSYHLSDNDFDNFEKREVVKYGKVNPMFYFAYNAPKSEEGDEDNINSPSLPSENKTDESGNKSKISGGPFVDTSGDSDVVGFNIKTNKYQDINIAPALFDFKQTGRFPMDDVYSENLSSGFGERKDPFTGKNAVHTGLDFSAVDIEGKNVYSATHGEILEIITSDSGYGNHVIVKHNGYTTLYAHLSSFSDEIKVGDRVSAGVVLGKVGSTGRSTGPHLHFEVRIGDIAVDPTLFMNEIRKVD